MWFSQYHQYREPSLQREWIRCRLSRSSGLCIQKHAENTPQRNNPRNTRRPNVHHFSQSNTVKGMTQCIPVYYSQKQFYSDSNIDPMIDILSHLFGLNISNWFTLCLSSISLSTESNQEKKRSHNLNHFKPINIGNVRNIPMFHSAQPRLTDEHPGTSGTCGNAGPPRRNPPRSCLPSSLAFS